ncbi:MAG: hypothetical protein EXR58_02490 [Chloroflexi bacterium]|nr:hypothetical protein [Chloroflexota bacterium]
MGIVFKGPEGIVLAADSRVTLMAEINQNGQKVLLPATFDNASKLLRVAGQPYVGVVTYGAGGIGQQAPRTAHSFMPEFEAELARAPRLSVEDFASALGVFFMKHWSTSVPADYIGQSMTFLVGGYDDQAPYGRTFEVDIPRHPAPQERAAGTFGITWGGQAELTQRLLRGYDEALLVAAQKSLSLSDEQLKQLGSPCRFRINFCRSRIASIFPSCWFRSPPSSRPGCSGSGASAVKWT